jgi:hypothetical protein
MSYILKALRRADEDRGETRPALSVRRPATLVRGPRWPLIVSGLLVLNLAVLGVAWLSTRSTFLPSPAHPPAAMSTPAPGAAAMPPPPAADVVESPRVAAAPPAPPRRPVVQVTPQTPAPPAPRTAGPSAAMPASRPSREPRPTTPEPVREAAPPERGALAAEAPEPPPVPAPAVPAAAPTGVMPSRAASPVEPAAPAPEGGDIKALTANLKLQVHVWAPDARDRVVFLNGRKYVEGQTVDGKVVVERIAEDGVVLAYQGQRVTLARP